MYSSGRSDLALIPAVVWMLGWGLIRCKREGGFGTSFACVSFRFPSLILDLPIYVGLFLFFFFFLCLFLLFLCFFVFFFVSFLSLLFFFSPFLIFLLFLPLLHIILPNFLLISNYSSPCRSACHSLLCKNKWYHIFYPLWIIHSYNLPYLHICITLIT